MFEWKPEYSVQIAEIDAQHQRLFALAANLHLAMSQGKGNAVLEEALSRLVNYTKAHFAKEEEFMRRHHYPATEAHKAEHEELTTQVLAFHGRFQRHEMVLTCDLLIFLKDWLDRHILHSDQAYAAFVRKKKAA